MLTWKCALACSHQLRSALVNISRLSSKVEVLEAKHRSGSGFDNTMVLLDEVVQVLRGPQFLAPRQQGVLSHLTDCAMRRSIAIKGDRVRRPTIIPNRLFEERLGCGYISCPTEPEVDSLPSLVYCPIQIGPLSAYLEIGFIHSPRAASAAAKAIPPLDELRRIPSNPAQNRRMGKLESSFGHHLHQITEAELVAQIPTHAQKETTRSKCRPANNSSMFLSLPIVSPRSQRPLYPTAPRYLHQSLIPHNVLAVADSISPLLDAPLSAFCRLRIKAAVSAPIQLSP